MHFHRHIRTFCFVQITNENYIIGLLSGNSLDDTWVKRSGVSCLHEKTWPLGPAKHEIITRIGWISNVLGL